jgi:hypothetical protein
MQGNIPARATTFRMGFAIIHHTVLSNADSIKLGLIWPTNDQDGHIPIQEPDS